MNSPHADPLRETVASELARLTANGGPAGRDSALATAHAFGAGAPSRVLFHQAIITQILARTTTVTRDAGAAIITAGVPGAGKSTALAALLRTDPTVYRDLDADTIKDFLLADALTSGLFNEMLTRQLPDGKPIAPRELATLVHDESVRIWENLRRLCLARGERIVIHGTLTWPGLGQQLADEICAAGYETIRIIAVDVPEAVAQQRALTRWWGPRCAGTDPLGGRFTPPAVIAAAYPNNPDRSICVSNARDLYSYVREEYSSVSVTLDIVDAHGNISSTP